MARLYLKDIKDMLAKPEWEEFRKNLKKVCEQFFPTPMIEEPVRRSCEAA